MGVLALLIEGEGIPSTQISLIREHTANVQPPRALWVPFELGRPFGAPDDAGIQMEVLKAVLGLLERNDAPLIEDFPGDVSVLEASPDWVQAAGLPVLDQDEVSAMPLTRLLSRELELIRPLHDVARKQRNRTTVGTSGLKTKVIVDMLASCVDEAPLPNPHPEYALGLALKLASEDLKAFYLEAASFHSSASSRQLADWFWDQTAAGEGLRFLRAYLKDHPDQWVRAFVRGMLIPAERIRSRE